ncbi:hypothetical protein CDL12_16210 [Handroanthus impetiginosus]|uniref:Cation/H(+) antiporter C-terminal domain-containing protein n=1 Tax=Handroanthus impetiginosus TaxID=429701 RepID=A0A2G9H120_9LAMI|nr:hypothetical protein CDL12_16210 [Handroanthus impetiginosus]
MEIDLGLGWRRVNQRVLENAPCSIGVLVDRGFGFGPDTVKKVCVPFLGGPDSREALRLAGRMANHPKMRVTVIRFCGSGGPEGEIKSRPSSSATVSNDEREEQDCEQDETALVEFTRRWDGIIKFIEKQVNNIVNEVLAIAQSTEFELIMVGKGRFSRAIVAELANHHVEYEELGSIGGLLASLPHGIKSSVLVIQQHDCLREGHSTHLKCFDERMFRLIIA